MMMEDILAQRIAALRGRDTDKQRTRLQRLMNLLRFRPFRGTRGYRRIGEKNGVQGDGEWGGP